MDLIKEWLRGALERLSNELIRYLSGAKSYVVYWNGDNINSKNRKKEFLNYHDATNFFQSKIVKGDSRYVELVAEKRNKELQTLMKISF